MRRSAAVLAVLASMVAASFGAAGANADGVVPIEGAWHATTSAGLPVRFTVEGGQVVGYRFRFNWGFCGTYTSEGGPPVQIESDGHWKYVEGPETFIEATFVAPDRAEGVVGAPSRMTPGCPQTRATFVAEPGAVPFTEPKVEVLADVRRGRHYERAPREMVLKSDGSFRFTGLHWRGWGEPVAHANGHAYIRKSGVVRRPRATVTLSELQETGEGKVYYELHYVLRGRLQAGRHHRGEFWLE
jgi:hypothetical protein